MNENIENTENIKMDVKDFQNLCNYIKTLEDENTRLKQEKRELQKEYDTFYTEEYLRRIDECNKLWGELQDIKHMSMFEFAAKYCKDTELEEAGHQLARSLGVGQ